MKKRAFAALLAAILAGCLLAACGTASGTVPDSTGEPETTEAAETAVPAAEESPVPLNNGGNVVGYMDSIYYWKLTADSYYEPTFNGCFSLDYSEHADELVRRDADGAETVLASGSCMGQALYICGGRVYFHLLAGWSSVTLDGGDRRDHGEGSIMLVDTDSGTVVYTGSDPIDLFTISGETQLGISGGAEDGVYPEPFAIADGYFYYYKTNTGDPYTIEVCRNTLDGQNNEVVLAVIDTGINSSESGIMTDGLLADGCIYISYTGFGGSGEFFFNGGLTRVAADGSEAVQLVSPDTDTALQYSGIYAATDADGSEYVYFYCGEDASVYLLATRPWLTGGTYRVSTATGEISPSDSVFLEDGGWALIDGGVYTRPSGSADCVMVISPSGLAAAGIAELGDLSSDTGCAVSSLDIVGEDTYLTVVCMHRDASQDIGWRTAYMRDSTSIYEFASGSDVPELMAGW